jgi:threonine aldolase
VFYIGGTKCGALFGEAVVVPDPGRIPHFFTIIKQHGALLAKGWLLGIQFDELFQDGLYRRLGAQAVRLAQQIQNALAEAGVPLFLKSPTNQIFCVLDQQQMAELSKDVDFGFIQAYDGTRTVVRFAASWATSQTNTDALCALIQSRF